MYTFYKAQMSYNNRSLHIWTSVIGTVVSYTELDHQSLIGLHAHSYSILYYPANDSPHSVPFSLIYSSYVYEVAVGQPN
jgi:hypothetical protein